MGKTTRLTSLKSQSFLIKSCVGLFFNEQNPGFVLVWPSEFLVYFITILSSIYLWWMPKSFFWFVTEEMLSITAGSDRGSYAKSLSAGCRRYHLTHTPLCYGFCNRRKANFLKFANAKAAATGFEPETRGDLSSLSHSRALAIAATVADSESFYFLKIQLCARPNLNVLLPCPSPSPKMFWAGPNILCKTKKLNCILCHSKKICAGTKMEFNKCRSSLGWAQYLNKFWSVTKNLD